MQSNENEPTLDPLMRILKMPGAGLRVAGLALGIAALFFPAFSRSGFDVSFHIDMAEALPHAAVLPIAAGVALVLAAVPRTAAYVRLADIAVAIVGAVLCMQLIALHGEGTRSAGSVNNFLRGTGDPRAAAGLEMGFWLIVASVASFGASALLSFRRRRNG